MKLKWFLKGLAITTAFVAVFLAGSAMASSSLSEGIALSSITANVNTTVSEMAKILTDIALIAGIGFILASLFKFHQHKLNPTQIPISQGVTLLLIGAALTLFVVMLPTAKRAVFGSAPMATIGGSQMTDIIGDGSSSGS